MAEVAGAMVVLHCDLEGRGVAVRERRVHEVVFPGVVVPEEVASLPRLRSDQSFGLQLAARGAVELVRDSDGGALV